MKFIDINSIKCSYRDNEEDSYYEKCEVCEYKNSCIYNSNSDYDDYQIPPKKYNKKSKGLIV